MRPCNTLMDHAYSSPAYPDAIRDLALSDSLGDQRADSYTMGPYVAVGGVGEQPVPCSVYAEVPQPALAVIREHVHARPEPSRLLGAQWFECVVRHSQKVSQERIGG